MLSPQALIRGLVSRVLPSSNPDGSNNDVAFRQGRYGEMMTQPMIRKAHNLADEGSYFVGTSNQTGVIATYNASFTDARPFLLIQNNASVASGTQVYLDWASFTTTVAGTAASAGVVTNMTVTVDSILRYSSGGTQITAIKSPNMNNTQAASVCSAYYGAITAAAASALTRTVVGLRSVRPAVSATVLGVVGDQYLMNFGGVEGMIDGFMSVTAAVPNLVALSLPPVIIGPQQSALINVWFNATTPASFAATADFGVWER